MRIAVIGATGNAGSRIVAELLTRGHQILGIARHPEKLPPPPQLPPAHTRRTPPTPPTAYKPEASAGRDFLNTLKSERDLDWTYLSPSVFFSPGERTGKYRVGKDQILTGADGQSKISMEDYAIAL